MKIRRYNFNGMESMRSLSFSRNNQFIGKMEIKRGLLYFPFVCTGHHEEVVLELR